MKKLLFAAAAVWLLAACNKELGPEYETPPVFDEVTFTTATQPDKITEPVKVDEVVWVKRRYPARTRSNRCGLPTSWTATSPMW